MFAGSLKQTITAVVLSIAATVATGSAAQAQVFIQPFPGVPGKIHVQPVANRYVFRDHTSGLTGEVLRIGGIRVVGVDAFSAADQAGLRPGDKIVSINGRAMRSHSDFARALTLSGGNARMVVIDGLTRRPTLRHAFLPVDAPRVVNGVVTQHVTTSLTVPVAEMADLNGWWKTDMGDMRIWQTGTSIIGRIEMTDGRRCEIKGKLVGDLVRFDWFISPKYQGDGELKVSASGGSLFGKFTGTTGAARSMVFKKS